MPSFFPDDLRRILDSLEVGVTAHAPDGALLYANQAAKRIAGLGFDREPGVPLREVPRIFSPEGRLLAQPEFPLMRVLTSEQAMRDAVIGVAAEDSDALSWWQVNALPQRSADTLDFVLCTFTNISARHGALREIVEDRQAVRAELLRSERLYQAMVESMSEGVIVLDTDGQIMQANPAAERMLRLKQDSLVGRFNTDPRWEMRSADGALLTRDQIPSVITLRTGRSFHKHPLWIGQGAARTCLSVNVVPIASPMGRRVVVTFTDVTDQERARTELESSQARYQSIVDAVPGLVFVLESLPALHFTYLSAAAADLLNLNPNELPSKVRWWTVHPEDRGRLRAIIEGGFGPLDMEFRLLLPERPTKWMQIKANAESVHGSAVWHGILLDVSERHVLESSLREAQRREVIGEMAAGIAHNFNNALSAVLPNLETALSSATEEAREALEDARIAALSASELVAQLLLIARNEPGTEHQALDLVQVVRSATRILRSTLPAHLGLQVSLCQQAPIIGHASLLQQVVLNLVLNARDALDGVPHPQISVSLARSGQSWSLEVCDNGPGVPPQIMEHLGEPFVTSKPAGKGTGLGLATVFSILEEHHGSLRVESSPSGARFSVCLPVAEPSLPLPSVEQPQARNQGLRILLVEDQNIVRRALARHLHRAGHQVIEAEGGEQALELERTQPLDVVLLDLSMPGMCGDEVLAILAERSPGLPVVILSGYWDPERHDLSAAAAVLRKPPDLPVLMQTLWDVALGEE